VSIRSPSLHASLRRFCLGGFALASREIEAGAEVPFSFEEHRSPNGPSLYEYRPLVRGFLEERFSQLAALEDARVGIEQLSREPAAALFARAHGEGRALDEAASLTRTVLLPLLVKTAEGCGGFDWSDEAFERAYAELEGSLFGRRRSYVAVAPLTGLSTGAEVELGSGLGVRVAVPGELAEHWPEANGLLPADFGREPDRTCVLELKRSLAAGDAEIPDAPAELSDAVSAIRLATAGAVAAGPVLFERLDWRPFGIRPVLPIAATAPDGEPIRLDAFRGRLAQDLRARLERADEDPELAEALDRWELSLFQAEPFRSEQLRESLTALLGETDGLFASVLRAAALLGRTGNERAAHLASLRALAGGESATPAAADAVRRALVEALAHGNRAALVASLDESLLGLGPRPTGFLESRLAVG